MATTHWKKATSGAWEDAKNWSGGVPDANDDVRITAGGHYTVTLSSDASCQSLTLRHATLVETADGSLATGLITVSHAALELDAANPGLTNMSAVNADASTIRIGHDDALGDAALTLTDGATLAGTVTTTLPNAIDIDSSSSPSAMFTIEAATGTVLTLSGALDLSSVDGTSLTFGGVGQEGRIIVTGDVTNFGTDIRIAAGVMEFPSLEAYSTMTIDEEATFDLDGLNYYPGFLFNNGLVSSSNGGAIGMASDITGSGMISGNLEVYNDSGGGDWSCYNEVNLTGSGSVYVIDGEVNFMNSVKVAATCAFVTEDGDFLKLDSRAEIDCKATGGGYLIVDGPHANVALNGGAGVYRIELNSGTLRMNANADCGEFTISGGKFIVANGVALEGTDNNLDDNFFLTGGVLSIGRSALDGQLVSLDGGMLFERKGGSIGQDGEFDYSGLGIVAAAHGVVATLTAGITTASGARLVFGGAGDDGVIVLAPAYGDFSGAGGNYSVEVAAGTLRIGDAIGNVALTDSNHIVVDAGATLDLNGWDAAAMLLTGGGTITTNAGGSLTVYGASSFSGAITGGLLIDVVGSLALSGPGSFTTLAIEGGATVTLSNGASEHVTMDDDPGATLALTDKATLKGSIEGFGLNDKLDLQGLAFQSGATTASYDTASHRLTVTTGFRSVVLTLDGSYTSGEFKVSDDGGGHTLVSYQDIRGLPPRPSSPSPHVFSHAAETVAEWTHEAHAITPHDPHLAVLV